MSPSASGCCHWITPGKTNSPRHLGRQDFAGDHRGTPQALQAFIREYLFVLLFQACAESLASENASRLAAMQRAEKNIENILEELSAGCTVFDRNPSTKSCSM